MRGIIDMTGYVLPVGAENDHFEPIEIDGTVGIGVFRKDETEGNVHFQTDDRSINLGHHDISVSRMRPDGAPVRFSKEGGDIYLRNVDNESPVEIDYLRSKEDLEKGEITKINNNCIVRPGYHTELMVTLDSDELPGGVVFQHIKAICDGFTHAVRNSDQAAKEYGSLLVKAMKEYPAEDEEYDELLDDFENELGGVESFGDIRKGDSGTERIGAFDELTSDIKNMYMYDIDS
jgi:hypothetical protein